jgi:hypothetical protein
VIEVGVSQNQAFNFLCRKRHILPIALAPFLLPLKQAAINQHLYARFARDVPGNVQQMLGPRNGARRAKELNVGQKDLLIESSSFSHIESF